MEGTYISSFFRLKLQKVSKVCLLRNKLYSIFHHNPMKYRDMTDGCYKLSTLIDSNVKECTRISEKGGTIFIFWTRISSLMHS